MSNIKASPSQTWHKHFSENFGEYAHAHEGGEKTHLHGPEGNQKYLGLGEESRTVKKQP